MRVREREREKERERKREREKEREREGERERKREKERRENVTSLFGVQVRARQQHTKSQPHEASTGGRWRGLLRKVS